jgi:hypothetical protein
LLRGYVDNGRAVIGHIRDSFKPSGEKVTKQVGFMADQAGAGIDATRYKVGKDVAEFHQDTSIARLDEFLDSDTVRRGAVNLMCDQGRDLRFRCTERRDLDTIVAPAELAGELLRQPKSERAGA